MPGLRARITHEDAAGFVQTLTTAGHYHGHRPVRGPLTLQAAAVTPGSRLTLAGTLTTPAGIKMISYAWETALDLLFSPATSHTSEEAYFALTPVQMGSDRLVRVKVRVTDDFNQVTELQPPAVTIARPVAGAMQLVPPELLYPGSTITALTTGLTDPNGGQVRTWAWRLGAGAWTLGTKIYTLTPPALGEYARGETLQLQAVHQDGFGHKTTLTAQLTNHQADHPGTISGFTLTGPSAFAPGAPYSAHFSRIIDPNGLGTVAYQWYTRTNPTDEFAAVVTATTAHYALVADDFAGTGHHEIKVVLIHRDPSGGLTRWFRTRRHQPGALRAPDIHAPQLRRQCHPIGGVA